MRYLTSFLGCAILALSSMGCISTTMYGTTEQTVLSPGAGEGEVIRKHGAPDNIVYLGEPYYNPTTGERGAVDKYLYEYRIGGGTTLLGQLLADDRFHNICYLIEGGRITEPIREGNLIGNGPAVLTRIDAVGNDFAMGSPGTCGKDGQGVAVGDGVPTLRAHGLTIGGTAA